MELTEREQEILKAFFDNYVRKEIIEKNSVTSQEDIRLDEPELDIECRSYDLYAAIMTSYCRITSEALPKRLEDSIQGEIIIENVMLLVVKDKIKQLAVSPVIWTRYFINTVDKLNEENRDLNLTTGEFINFFHPIYWEVITELVSK
jgi:predicted transglutaminase-like protease